MSGIGAKFLGGNPDAARGRATNDFYPTPKDATRAFALRYAFPLAGTVLWECCAGDGAMLDVLGPFVTAAIGTDIEPRRAGIAMADVLDPALDRATKFRMGITSVVTNPPFNLSERIIRRILTPGFLPNLRLFAIVSKGTFWHAAARLPLWSEHQPYAVHPLTWRLDFQNLGRPVMECAWIVWAPQRCVENTIYQPWMKPA